MSGQSRVLVKSGGLSTQLEKYVGENVDGDPLWSSRFDISNPKAIIQTHLDFLNSGSQIINTNTYQASVEGYMKHMNVSREAAIQLIRSSVKLTKQAKEEFLKTTKSKVPPGLPLVIAAIGPYGAFLHDFSEYSGDYADKVTVKQLQNWHRPRIDAILAEGVDLLGFETIPCQIEAEAIVDMMLEDYKESKFYISFQCKTDKTLAHGENFADVVSMVWNRVKSRGATVRLVGIGVNCVNPRNVATLFKSLHADQKGVVPLLVYSNRDEVYNTEVGEWQFNEGQCPLESFVPEWVELGAKIVGGCCRVYPEDIVRVRKCVDELNAKKCEEQKSDERT